MFPYSISIDYAMECNIHILFYGEKLSLKKNPTQYSIYQVQNSYQTKQMRKFWQKATALLLPWLQWEWIGNLQTMMVTISATSGRRAQGSSCRGWSSRTRTSSWGWAVWPPSWRSASWRSSSWSSSCLAASPLSSSTQVAKMTTLWFPQVPKHSI